MNADMNAEPTENSPSQPPAETNGPPVVTLPGGLVAHVVVDDVMQPSVVPPAVRETPGAPKPGTVESMALSFSPAQQAEAFRMFLEKQVSLETLALQLEIPLPVIALWSQQDKWLDRRRTIQKELIAHEEIQYRQMVLEQRPKVLRRHLEVTEAIEDKVKQTLEHLDPEDPKAISKLRMLAESMSSSANVSARAAAITDRPFSGSSQGKTPVIIIGAGPVAGPGKPGNPEVRVVDVESHRVRE